MEKNLLQEISDKLDLFLSLFTIKEDGKEKTVLEKYKETEQERKEEQNKKVNLQTK